MESKVVGMRAEKHTKSQKPALSEAKGRNEMIELKEQLEKILPEGSAGRVAVGVTAAAAGGLLAAFLLGVGPAAIAGTAGYLAYRGLSKREDKKDTSTGA